MFQQQIKVVLNCIRLSTDQNFRFLNSSLTFLITNWSRTVCENTNLLLSSLSIFLEVPMTDRLFVHDEVASNVCDTQTLPHKQLQWLSDWLTDKMRNTVPATRAGRYPRAGFCDLQLNELMSEKPTVCHARHCVRALWTCVAELQDFQICVPVMLYVNFPLLITPLFMTTLLFTILFEISPSFVRSFVPRFLPSSLLSFLSFLPSLIFLPPSPLPSFLLPPFLPSTLLLSYYLLIYLYPFILTSYVVVPLLFFFPPIFPSCVIQRWRALWQRNCVLTKFLQITLRPSVRPSRCLKQLNRWQDFDIWHFAFSLEYFQNTNDGKNRDMKRDCLHQNCRRSRWHLGCDSLNVYETRVVLINKKKTHIVCPIHFPTKFTPLLKIYCNRFLMDSIRREINVH